MSKKPDPKKDTTTAPAKDTKPTKPEQPKDEKPQLAKDTKPQPKQDDKKDSKDSKVPEPKVPKGIHFLFLYLTQSFQITCWLHPDFWMLMNV